MEPSKNGRPHYRAKELSWLSFNARLLQEAQNEEVPLFERLRFLGIFSANLDEFFRVRVAALTRFAALGGKAKPLFGRNPRRLLKEVQQQVLELSRRFDAIYQELLAELARQDVHILNERQLDPAQASFVRAYFRRQVRPKLIPIMIDQAKQFPDLRDGAPYLIVDLRTADRERKQQALIEIPTTIRSRFLVLPPQGAKRFVILLDDVIRSGLQEIFGPFGFERIEAYMVKLTRDAELDVEDDLTQSIAKKLSRGLKRRNSGDPVRIVYDAALPPPLLKLLTKRLGIEDPDALIPGARYHNLRDFMRFPDFGSPRFYYEPVEPLTHPKLPPGQRVMEAMRGQDILVHYPYFSFDPVIDLLREASIDPEVQSIKFTIYRAAQNSSVVNALINAARNGKSVVVVVELQARFDEEANLHWGDRLREAGVKVIYGVPGLKVHSKLCLVTRREAGGAARRYAIVGTGNFNEDTARIYSDHALFTADRRITGEIHKVFRFYERNYDITGFEHLLVSPLNMRKKFLRLIANEVRNAKAGRPAEIVLKLNNLVDGEVIAGLCRAAQAGVKVRLIVRSMFSLVTDVPGVSEGIEAISIVDKYLEHSRIFVFHNGGKRLYFISSSDLMRRNLDNRVEVTCPIYDKGIQRELQAFLDIQFADNVKARVLNGPLDNRIRRGESGKRVRAQMAIYDYLKSLAAGAAAAEGTPDARGPAAEIRRG